MKNISLHLILLLILFACGSDLNEQKNSTPITFVELPEDFSTIPDSTFEHVSRWLENAEIIGISEGEHGMNEALDFRNSYIKYLVRTMQIQVLAFETGLIESRLVNRYIHGENLNLDSVLTNGICYTFGQFEQNRELLIWLRETNAERANDERVRFYGFDMSGNASNPWLDNPSFAFKEFMKYLKNVDQKQYNEVHPKLQQFYAFLNIQEPRKGKQDSFRDLSPAERMELEQLINQLKEMLSSNRAKYVSASSKNEYEWAERTIEAAQQNLTFLNGFVFDNGNQSSRERFMLDNLQWIREKEGNKKILLFAHLAHLAKDMSRPNESGVETLPNKMFGELLAEKYGSRYQLIGNFFSYLDYYDSVDSVHINSFPERLRTNFEATNFCLKVDPADSIFQSNQVLGIPYRGQWNMTPKKGIDVVLYTERQHYFYKE